MVGCRSHSHVSAATGTSTCPRAGQWNRLTATSGSTSTSAWGLMGKSSPVPSPLVLSLSIITLEWTSRRFLSEYDVKISTQKYLMFSKNWASLALLDPWLFCSKTALFDMYLKVIIILDQLKRQLRYTLDYVGIDWKNVTAVFISKR